MHRTLEQVLRSLIAGKDTNWANILPIAEFYMNSAPSSSTGESPHEIIFGTAPINPYTSVLSLQVTSFSCCAPSQHAVSNTHATFLCCTIASLLDLSVKVCILVYIICILLASYYYLLLYGCIYI